MVTSFLTISHSSFLFLFEENIKQGFHIQIFRHCSQNQKAAHPDAAVAVVFADPDPVADGRFLSSLERSSGSLEYLVVSFGALRLAEVIRAAAGSLGGGGRGDLIFPAPTGGGASPRVLGFPLPESAADNIPVPLDGLGFTFIRMVSPSFSL